MDGIIDTETNLFEQENDGMSNFNDEDDDSLKDVEANLLVEASQQQQQTPEQIAEAQAALEAAALAEEEDPNKLVFDALDEEDENDQEMSDEDLASFNKKMGTDFKSSEELKKSFNKLDAKNEEEQEAIELTKYQKNVELYDEFIKMDDEQLIRHQLTSQAQLDKKDINSDEVKEEIEDTIAGLKDLNTLKTMADNLRGNLKNLKEKSQQSADKIIDKNNKKAQESSQKKLQEIQSTLTEVFQEGHFMGVEVTKEMMTEVYLDIKSEKFHDRANKDQGLIARLALFERLEEEILKRATAPTHSDKTKSAFAQLVGNDKNKPRNIAQASGSATGSDVDNVLAFVGKANG